MIFTDSHCHLDFPELFQQLPQLLTKCSDKNIKRIVIPSVDPNNWQNVLDLSQQHQSTHCQLLACLGIHPWFLDSLSALDLSNLTKLATEQQTELAAIGETGIDLTIAEQSLEPEKHLAKQIDFFEYQLHLANQLNLPVIIHHRKSHQHIVPILKKMKVKKAGIIHAFSGSFEQAKNYLDLGFKLGIGGTITYPRALKTIKTVTKLPLQSLVLETDAPAMPLNNFQGQVNTPLRILDIFQALIALRSEPKREIAAQLEKNVAQVFNCK